MCVCVPVWVCAAGARTTDKGAAGHPRGGDSSLEALGVCLGGAEGVSRLPTATKGAAGSGQTRVQALVVAHA